MKGIIRLVPPLLGLCLAACAVVDGPERISRLEEHQARDRQVMDLRMSNAEDRLTQVEGDVRTLKQGPAAAERPAGRAGARTGRAAAQPRQSTERLPAAPQTTGTAPLGDMPRAPEIPYLPRTDLAQLGGSAAAYAAASPAPPAAAPVASAPVAAPPASSAPVASSPAPNADGGPGLVPMNMAAKAPAAKPAKSSSGNSSKTGSGAYDAALALYNRGEYEKAQQDFAAFTQSSPGSALVPNALYWQGECQYSLGKYGEAIMSFKDVAAKYPKHAKAAAALLKAGYSYERLKDMENARFYWQLLLDDFPRSAPAALARKKMGAAG